MYDRTGATLESSDIIQSALPELPQLYVPDIDSLDQMCSKLQASSLPVRFLDIVGGPGRGVPGWPNLFCHPVTQRDTEPSWIHCLANREVDRCNRCCS